MDLPTLYGLDTCDTCGKARRWLEREGVAYRFIDYRAQPIPGDMLKAWAAALGWDALINRSSTTWRNLLPNRKDPRTDAEYILLLRDHPALLRRPFAVIGDEFLVGFSGGHYEKRFRQAGQAP